MATFKMMKQVKDLQDGDYFSLTDGGDEYTCAMALFGSVTVYSTGVRGDDAMCRRIDADRDQYVYFFGNEND